MKLGQYILGIIIKPQKTFNELLKEKHSIRYSLLCMLIWSILYSLISLQLHFVGEVPLNPWVKIPVNQYYL